MLIISIASLLQIIIYIEYLVENEVFNTTIHDEFIRYTELAAKHLNHSEKPFVQSVLFEPNN